MMTRRMWTEDELRLLDEFYAHIATAEIAAELHRTVGQVYQAAAKRGVRKTGEFLASAASGRLQGEGGPGVATRFRKGQMPPNKGIPRRRGWAPGRMGAHQFRKGERPHTWQPIGTERVTRDGYLQRKVTDTGSTVADYVEVHRVVWEAAHGPVPEGLVVAFKDGDKRRIELGNLELLTRGELMLRNTIHRLPKPLVGVILMNGALKRKIREYGEKQR